MKKILNMTKADFYKIPYRKSFDKKIGLFDSLIILPCEIKLYHVLLYKFKMFLNKICKWIKEPQLWEIDGLHDSGYRCMDFVAVKNGKPLYRLSGCSDVLHFDGIGGYGKWTPTIGIPELIKPKGVSIDCLPNSGLLQIFCNGKIECGMGLSSFEIWFITTPK